MFSYNKLRYHKLSPKYYYFDLFNNSLVGAMYNMMIYCNVSISFSEFITALTMWKKPTL